MHFQRAETRRHTAFQVFEQEIDKAWHIGTIQTLQQLMTLNRIEWLASQPIERSIMEANEAAGVLEQRSRKQVAAYFFGVQLGRHRTSATFSSSLIVRKC
ncbi:MAG: hypothetical protein CMJ90_11185 [Planctomycetes bacterium]|nr:hypothetical protein [Planctomycetota bacterium]